MVASSLTNRRGENPRQRGWLRRRPKEFHDFIDTALARVGRGGKKQHGPSLDKLTSNGSRALHTVCEATFRKLVELGDKPFSPKKAVGKAAKGVLEVLVPGVPSPPIKGIVDLAVASATARGIPRSAFQGLSDHFESVSDVLKAIAPAVERASELRLTQPTLSTVKFIEAARAAEANMTPSEFRSRMLTHQEITIAPLPWASATFPVDEGEPFSGTEAFIQAMEESRRLAAAELRTLLCQPNGIEGLPPHQSSPPMKGREKYEDLPWTQFVVSREGGETRYVLPEIIPKAVVELTKVLEELRPLVENPHVEWGTTMTKKLQDTVHRLAALREELLDVIDSVRYARLLVNGFTTRKIQSPDDGN